VIAGEREGHVDGRARDAIAAPRQVALDPIELAPNSMQLGLERGGFGDVGGFRQQLLVADERLLEVVLT
jgi:hypothetical protein